jgi:hypothetical protein
MKLIEKQNKEWQDLSSEVINTGSPVARPPAKNMLGQAK